MSQSTPTIGANKTGLQYRQEDNDGKKALLNHHKGSTAPSYKEAGMIWLDDAATPWLLKFYDGADWITLGEVNATANTFNPFTGTAAPKLLNYAPDSGAANAYAVTPVPAITSYVAGQAVMLKPANANSGAATLAVSGLTAKNIKLPDGTNPGANAMLTTGIYTLVYDGTNFILTNPAITGGMAILASRGTTLASASTVDLGAADSDYVEISGTTTITSFGSTTTRNHVWVKFQGALTLTHNGTSLILPSGANILTAAGDRAEFVRISGSNWQCLNYERASGAPLLGASSIDTQIFTASGTWNKPASGTIAFVQVWGAGGGGGTHAAGGGGGGGGYNERWIPYAALSSTESVTIGAGGGTLTAGGNSTFGSWVTGFGGGASNTTNGGGGGGGGGSAGSGSNAVTSANGLGGLDMGGGTQAAATASSIFGGGGGGGSSAGAGAASNSRYGGGGGSQGASGAYPGNSIYGGAGGGSNTAAPANGVGGISTYGGNGGSNGVNGFAPGGGGGRNASGARGEVRVYVF